METNSIPVCVCGHQMLIDDISCGIASMFFWACPKEHWWSRKKHSSHISLGTGVARELAPYMRGRQ
jgi:hypothetical protein